MIALPSFEAIAGLVDSPALPIYLYLLENHQVVEPGALESSIYDRFNKLGIHSITVGMGIAKLKRDDWVEEATLRPLKYVKGLDDAQKEGAKA